MRALLMAIAIGAIALAGVARADNDFADRHAPIGVMGDHRHAAGEWMFSYRFMRMDMAGSRDGSSRIDADTIATTAPNPFAGMPGMPPTLRIVPTDMSMDMHMLGAMYAPNDRVTLMFMTGYWQKSMNHVSYAGGMGSNVLGSFRTETSGISDSSIDALYGLIDEADFRLHLIAGLSLPTGSVDESDDILTPANMRPEVRVPYPMQLGSGSFDPRIGLNAAGFAGALGWGGQWHSTFRIMDNDEDYQLGDEHRLSAWLSYRLAPKASVSLRLSQFYRGNIDGRDPSIMGPVQTADPDRQAIDRTELAIGLNLAAGKGWRIGIEYSEPLRQDLDGPQLETDRQLVFGLQFSP